MINKSQKSRVIISSILCLGLAACTSIPITQVNDRIHAWKNVNVEQLIKYWGVPTKKQEISGEDSARIQSRPVALVKRLTHVSLFASGGA